MANALTDVERHAGVLVDKMNRRAAAAVDNALLDIVGNANDMAKGEETLTLMFFGVPNYLKFHIADPKPSRAGLQ